MKQHYMTYPERIRLETMLKYKVPVSQIARDLGCCRQTIYNEMRRGEYIHTGEYKDYIRYSADKAQQVHDRAQRNKGQGLKIGSDITYANFLEERILRDRYSPAAALVAARSAGFTTSICITTLYAYIDQGVFYALTNNDLWEKPHRRKRAARPERRIVYPKLPSIEQRPQWIDERQERGHWEMDLVVGKAKTRAALLTLTERTTREEIIRKIPDKTSASIITALDQMERERPDLWSRIDSITTDNGPEFLNYESIRRSIYGGLRCEVWYCHSYAAWEKGTNERNNRIIRRWFPKGTDFTKITKKRISEVERWMNHYPRKILQWQTSSSMTA